MTLPATTLATASHDKALRFACEGEPLIGILHQPDPTRSSRRLGVLIVVGDAPSCSGWCCGGCAMAPRRRCFTWPSGRVMHALPACVC